MFVHRDPLGNSGGPQHPWNQHTIPPVRLTKRDFDDKYSWVEVTTARSTARTT